MVMVMKWVSYPINFTWYIVVIFEDIYIFDEENFGHVEPDKSIVSFKGEGGQAFHFGKNYFELGVGGDGQDTS